MKFTLTPEEAQGIADAVAKHFKKRGAKVKAEHAAWAEAPCCTTLVAIEKGKTILVEAQGNLSYGPHLQDLSRWLAVHRHYCEFFLATGAEGTLPVGLLSELRRDGVGLLIVEDDHTVRIDKAARNPALVVTPEPTLAYGDCKKEVLAAVEKFNNVDRKDGLRDMCEVVERETAKLIQRTAGKGVISVPVATVDRMDWSSQINCLASAQQHSGTTGTVGESLKNDLHSFRGARNLINHKVKSKRDDKKRQKQFAERMMMGPRLAADLVALRRKIK